MEANIGESQQAQVRLNSN